ncbi:MAG: hypothetical protein MZV70_63925 [Desulfobacterales bacterium]|nr:hypothetical protein [Desulfobacterales bacterium]
MADRLLVEYGILRPRPRLRRSRPPAPDRGRKPAAHRRRAGRALDASRGRAMLAEMTEKPRSATALSARQKTAGVVGGNGGVDSQSDPHRLGRGFSRPRRARGARTFGDLAGEAIHDFSDSGALDRRDRGQRYEAEHRRLGDRDRAGGNSWGGLAGGSDRVRAEHQGWEDLAILDHPAARSRRARHWVPLHQPRHHRGRRLPQGAHQPVPEIAAPLVAAVHGRDRGGARTNRGGGAAGEPGRRCRP